MARNRWPSPWPGKDSATALTSKVVARGLVVSEMGRRLVKAGGVADIGTLDGVSPFGHVRTPTDVDRVVLLIVSGLSGYVTGQRVEVDGGGMLRQS